MNNGIYEFIAKCSNWQQVKVDNQKPGGFAQNIELPKLKWEMINIDIITGLPKSHMHHDSSWVIIDRMTKGAHLLPLKTTYWAEDYALLYIHKVWIFMESI